MAFLLGRKSKFDLLIVGLGNPGIEYENTRHNVGFEAADKICEKTGAKLSKYKYKANFGEAIIANKRVLVMKPLTFMNLSGEAVKPVADFYKIPTDKIIVLSDDVSLPAGRLRIKRQGSDGGHNGLKSIFLHLGTEEIMRIKIGVGEKPSPDYDLAKWVLGRFDAKTKPLIDKACEDVYGAVKTLLESGIDSAMNKYN